MDDALVDSKITNSGPGLRSNIYLVNAGFAQGDHFYLENLYVA